MGVRARVFLIAAGVMLLAGCYSETEERLSVRLDRFMHLLNEQETALVDAREYKEAAAALARRVEADAGLRQAYESVLDEENILFFNYEQAIRFFAGSIDGRIRFFRFVKMLREAELLAFNEGRHAELSRFLLARFEARPALEKDYEDRIAPKRSQDNEEELYADYLWTKHILPFAVLYRFMSETERAMLADGDGSMAARSLMARRASDPRRIQQTLENIYILLPETRAYEFPVTALIHAALTNIQDQQSRRALMDIAAGIADGRSREALQTQITAAGISFPPLSERQKRIEQIEDDVAWFDAFVKEEIDFFN